MKKFLIEFTVLYIAGLIIFFLMDAIIPDCSFSTKNIFLFSLIMPALICGAGALGGDYNGDNDDDGIFF